MSANIATLKPLAALGQWTITMLWIEIALHVLGIPILLGMAVVGRIVDGVPPSAIQIVVSLALVFWAILVTIANVATAIMVILWINRARSNLSAKNVQGLKYSPSITRMCWFIPVANWIVPYRVTAEVWAASNPQFDGQDWKKESIPKRFRVWWICWLVYGGFSIVSSRLLDGDVALGASIWAFGIVFNLCAAWTFIKIVRDVDHRQMHKFPELKAIN